MVHEQKFEDLLSSKGPVSVKGSKPDLETWASDSILTGDIGLFCFHVLKPLMPMLALLPMLGICENLQ